MVVGAGAPGCVAQLLARELGPEFHDPDVNAMIRVMPRRAFGLADEDLVASATRWTFDD